MTTFSYSQVRTYDTCQYMWYTTYKRGIRRIFATKPMELGSAVHAGLANYFRGDDFLQGILTWANQTMPGWEDEGVTGDFALIAQALREIVYDAILICARAIKSMAGRYIPVMYEGQPIVEREFRVPIGKDYFVCVIDLCVHDRETGQIMLLDFKVREKMGSEPEFDFDVQMALYQAALLHHGIHTDGSIVYQIRSVIPQKPVLNREKNGVREMSRSGSIITDWETYREALIENNLDPADYLDMQIKLSDRKFQQEIRQYRSVETLEAYWTNFLETVRRIKSYRRGSPITRNISYINCPRCVVRDFCQSEFNHQDTSWMLGTLYREE